MAKPIDVGPEEFEAEVLRCRDRPVLVDFWSETCGHCLALNPHYDKAAEDKGEQVKFVKVSYQHGRDLFKDYDVRSTPTLVLFKNGNEIARTVGARSADALKTWLDEHLAD